jgi:hypothetical protein
MDKEVRIEHYLLQVDRELAGLPVSQRAQVITGIKSHIQDSLQRDELRGVESVLSDLGSPRLVAERYLNFKDALPVRSRRSGRLLKWLAVGTVAFFGAIFILGMTLAWYLSPFLKIGDVVANQVLQGGLDVKGEEDLTDRHVQRIKIPFNTAKIRLGPAESRKLAWDCKAAVRSQPNVDLRGGVLTLDLDVLNFAKCSILLPTGTAVDIQGVNGQMEVESPRDHLNIALNNGRVEIRPDPTRVYDFEVKVKNGLQDFFPRSTNRSAVKVRVNVVNGLVKKE